MSDLLFYLGNHLISFLFSIGLLGLIIYTSRINKKNKRVLASIVIATILLAIFECLETVFTEDNFPNENLPRYIFSVGSYILRPIIIVLFYHIRINFKSKVYFLMWVGVLVNTVIYILALFAYHNPGMRFVIWFNENNIFNRAWLGYTVYVISGIYILSFVITTIALSTIQKTKRQIDVIIIFTALFAVIIQVFVQVFKIKTTFTAEVFVIGSTLYFIYLNYEKATDEAIIHEREMQAKTTALMLSQIQPHFIYNTLATIQVLCEIDPEKASRTIADFSKYLRMNTDALSKTEPVPVSEEIKHAMAYADIEMTRFDHIKVLFIIKDKDFKLPVLTIEPMLENAIKYGVRPKENGRVEVITYKEDNKHVLIIKDNGVGFVSENLDYSKNHVGIDNVKTRVKNMVNGTFDIKSVLNEGTVVTITVPEEE